MRGLIFLLFITNSIYAQDLQRPLLAVSAGFGAYSQDHADLFSIISNQASLAQLKRASAAVYAERRFLLSELSNYLAVFGLPAGPGNFGLQAGYSGFNDYRETRVGIAYARKLDKKVDAGLRFNYQQIRISSGYGRASAISFDAGVILHVTDKLHAGVLARNPVGGKFGKHSEEKLSSVFAFGMGYDVSGKFFFSAEIEKEEDRPVNINTGVQYQFLPRLMVRGGTSTATSSLWLGAGLLIHSFRLDIVTSYQPQLGISPGMLLLFEFKKDKK